MAKSAITTPRHGWRLPHPLRRSLTLAAVFIAMLHAVCGAQAPVSSPPPGRVPRVLVLYSDERLLPANIIADEAIRKTFAVGTSSQLEFHSEFLDPARFPGQAHEQRQRDYLRDKYAERPPDLLIAGGGHALAFLTRHHAVLFGKVPIVYCSVAGDPRPPETQGERIAEVPVFKGAVPTLELALQLHPDTRHVAIVFGSSQQDHESAQPFLEDLKSFGDRLAFTSLTDLSMEDLRGALSRLPDHTIVLYLVMFQDASGRTYTPRQALDEFASASRAPIYGCYDTYLGHGIVGGTMVTFEDIGRKAALLGLRILNGEDPQTAAQSESHQPVPMFDWREARRWRIPEDHLPAGSVLRFREDSFWEKNRLIIFGALALLALETLLIVALLVQLRRRRRAEASLRESEASVNLALASAGAGLWSIDNASRAVWLTDRAKTLFGFDPGDAPDWERFRAAIHPEDREAVEHAVRESLASQRDFFAECRVKRSDGSDRWISSRGRPHQGPDGKTDRLMGASVDITERKHAEDEIRQHARELAHMSRVSLVGELSGALVHELSQPLAAVLSNTETAELHLTRGSTEPSEMLAILADIRQDCLRAGEIIRGMRGFLRRQQAEFQRLDIRALVSDVEKLVTADALSRHAALTFQTAAELPSVHGHRVQLQQVLVNLILNGLQAMEDCPADEREIVVTSTRLNGSHVEITVCDQGHGLAADRLDDVFTPFLTTKSTGLGIGLSICRRIVEAHGGAISIQNNAARGATARFTLPVR